MACHEIAALRLGMMNVLGIEDEAERQHESNEIGKETLEKAGPIRSLAQAKNFASLKKFYDASLSELEQKVAGVKTGDPQLAYYRSLLILTKKVEMEMRNCLQSFEAFYRDLEEMHDFVHEIYPAD